MKPIVFLSSCLANEPCRYNGEALNERLVQTLGRFITFKRVCPEVAIGLGTPREPIRIVKLDGELRLLQPATGLDVTERMNHFSATFLKSISEADGFLLKARSPSCGVREVKIYSGAMANKTGPGIFAAAVQAHFPLLAAEDEGRLKNFDIREHYLTRIFTHARWRALRQKPTMAKLVLFQAQHKLLLLSHSEKKMRELGRVAANQEGLPLIEVIERYETLLGQAFEKPARASARINVYQHAFGFFSDKLTSAEKKHFLTLLSKVIAKRIPFSALTSLLRSWILRFNIAYLNDQIIFEPYPEELVSVSDSGKGRE